MKYRTRDDQTFEAATAEDLVTQIHKSSHTQSEGNQAWMERTADLAKKQSGKDVRTDTAENFVSDLAAAGLLEKVD